MDAVDVLSNASPRNCRGRDFSTKLFAVWERVGHFTFYILKQLPYRKYLAESENPFKTHEKHSANSRRKKKRHSYICRGHCLNRQSVKGEKEKKKKKNYGLMISNRCVRLKFRFSNKNVGHFYTHRITVLKSNGA